MGCDLSQPGGPWRLLLFIVFDKRETITAADALALAGAPDAERVGRSAQVIGRLFTALRWTRHAGPAGTYYRRPARTRRRRPGAARARAARED